MHVRWILHDKENIGALKSPQNQNIPISLSCFIQEQRYVTFPLLYPSPSITPPQLLVLIFVKPSSINSEWKRNLWGWEKTWCVASCRRSLLAQVLHCIYDLTCHLQGDRSDSDIMNGKKPTDSDWGHNRFTEQRMQRLQWEVQIPQVFKSLWTHPAFNYHLIIEWGAHQDLRETAFYIRMFLYLLALSQLFGVSSHRPACPWVWETVVWNHHISECHCRGSQMSCIGQAEGLSLVRSSSAQPIRDINSQELNVWMSSWNWSLANESQREVYMDINFLLYSLYIYKIYFVHSKILWNIYPSQGFLCIWRHFRTLFYTTNKDTATLFSSKRYSVAITNFTL